MTDDQPEKVVHRAKAANGGVYEVREEQDENGRTLYVVVRTTPPTARLGSTWTKAAAVKRVKDIETLARKIEQAPRKVGG